MARSKYIYLIRKWNSETRELLGAFTVKHEAVEWAVRQGWGPHNADLSRMPDGTTADKTETPIDWPVARG